MVKDAWFYIIPLMVAAVAGISLGFTVLALGLVLLALFVAFFFRNPAREIPSDPTAIVSPADGKVIRVIQEEEGTRLSIFLSVFNVHVNRAPIEGTIVRQVHQPGRFRLAFDDRASVENERLVLTIRDERQITFSLIAGLVARRIVPWKKEGDFVAKGDRIALIRFGSRVDIVLPSECDPVVGEGDRVLGGSSIVAHWRVGK